MYERHFGLRSSPFQVTNEPSHYYPSQQHREALAALTFGVNHCRGLMTLIGEVGTGKTTLLHALMAALGPSTSSVFVSHTTVDRDGLLTLILDKLHTARIPGWGANPIVSRNGEPNSFKQLSSLSRVELLISLNRFVAAEYLAHRRPLLLIIDEAQHLGAEVLEEVRLLTNLEGPGCKLIQVILAGQTELEETLLLPELRQLRQRIAVAARLKPLSLDEVVDYVRHRLAQSGYQGQGLFSRAALQVIWAASEGSPRTINILCDYALVNAFALGLDKVDAATARDAVHDALDVRDSIRLLQKPRTYVVSKLSSGSARPAHSETVQLIHEDGG